MRMLDECSWCGEPILDYEAPQMPRRVDDGSWWCGWCVDKYLSNCEPIDAAEYNYGEDR
jgi:hypothetical protein